jgi:hypothetical protein
LRRPRRAAFITCTTNAQAKHRACGSNCGMTSAMMPLPTWCGSSSFSRNQTHPWLVLLRTTRHSVRPIPSTITYLSSTILVALQDRETSSAIVAYVCHRSLHSTFSSSADAMLVSSYLAAYQNCGTPFASLRGDVMNGSRRALFGLSGRCTKL